MLYREMTEQDLPYGTHGTWNTGDGSKPLKKSAVYSEKGQDMV